MTSNGAKTTVLTSEVVKQSILKIFNKIQCLSNIQFVQWKKSVLKPFMFYDNCYTINKIKL